MWNVILKLVLGQLGPLLQVVFSTLTDRKTMDTALVYAQVAVARLEGDTSKDNATKRQAAFDTVVSDLKAAGKTVVPVIANLAVEAALAGLRAGVK